MAVAAKTNEKKWALVTGASSGIGTALAEDAAKRGYALVLVARRKDRLDTLAKKLGDAHGVEVVVVATDLSTSDGIDVLWRATEEKRIFPEVFFNNAGYGTNTVFLDADRSRELGMVDLNCRSLVDLCHRYGRAMRTRKSGTIVNVASVLSFMPAAYMAVYAATKAFVLSFSEALATELRPDGVSVIALCPGRTATEFADVAGFQQAKSNGGGETAAQVSATAWRAIDGKRTVAVSGLGNRVSAVFLRHAPRGIILKITERMRPAQDAR